MSNHKHHIVPIYKCIELGLTTSYKIGGIEFYFKENMVEVPREQHALIHWGYWCNDLSPLLEVCNPSQWVIDMIPLGDNRDGGAASIIALGEIEQIDMSGENNPMWKGGISVGDNRKAYYQTPKFKEYMKAYYQTPEYKEYKKEYQKAYRQTPKGKAYLKKQRSTPEYKEYMKAYKQTPENNVRHKEYMKVYQQTPEYKARKSAQDKARYFKKKLEKQQGQGTLDQFLK